MDTEFIEDGRDIDLVSIGIVCEDGREYYGQSCEFRPDSASDWVIDNVFPHLSICPHGIHPKKLEGAYLAKYDRLGHPFGPCSRSNQGDCPWRTRDQIKDEIKAFVNASEGKPELWGYYSAYDHVALCQLFGPMISLPKGWPMYTRDIKQWCDQLGNPRLPEQGKGEHNAISDARWVKKAWDFLSKAQEEATHEQ